jgi:branched-chain amino acid transport system ATP-binding protein
VLELRNLTGGWAGTTVIENLDLKLAPGDTTAIIGRNGVGKSTLLELVVGRAERQTGQILLGDADLSARPGFRRAVAGIGYVPQEREVFPSLTVAENLSVAKRPGIWTEERVYELFPGLAHRRKNLGWQLSGGEQQMLSVARALIGNPKILLMDEPTEGLAPVVVEKLVESLRAVVGDGSLSVLLVEQSIDVALDLSTRCLIMDRGRIVHDGPSANLREDPDTIARLMGLE